MEYEECKDSIRMIWDEDDKVIAIGNESRGGLTVLNAHSGTIISRAVFIPPRLFIKFENYFNGILDALSSLISVYLHRTPTDAS